MKQAKSKAVGIYDKEIYIANLDENGNITHFDVIRPVTAQLLSDLRDPDTYQNYCEDLWKEAVRAGATKSSLLEFAEELIDEADVDNDEEAFPLKDDSDCDKITQEEREVADNFLLEVYGLEVGTWKSAGAYPPNSERYHKDGWYSDFKQFDYEFEPFLCQQYYDSLK